MRARWNRWVDLLSTSFWFVPMVMLFLSGGLAWLLLYVDRRYDPGMKDALDWAYTGGPQGARSLLSTIAGSMITAASVTFSLAAVALSISSQQYGSRVLRNFMRDKVTQVLLGTFVSTFLYSVLVVRTIRGTDISGGFVPSISVTVAIGLALASLVLLVYFIHHISTSIQASHIVRVISEDMGDSILRLYPGGSGDPAANPDRLRGLRERESMSIASPRSGYLESLDVDELLEVATHQDVVLEVVFKPGDHLVERDEIVRVWGAGQLPDKPIERIQNSFLFGGERTPLQDIRYQFQQLTEVVIRALSPGINDPFTAVNGIDELTTGMALLARQPRPNGERQDRDGHLRLILSTPQVPEILEESVGHIATYGAGDRFVMARLRRLLAIVAPDLHGENELRTLARLRA
ncbi:MAG: DUF2254 domain-containing protein, partial [Acidobacteriaceae bacterium]